MLCVEQKIRSSQDLMREKDEVYSRKKTAMIWPILMKHSRQMGGRVIYDEAEIPRVKAFWRL